MCATLIEAKVSKSIHVTAAGTLSTLLTDVEKSTITNLVLSGTVDVRDLKFIRQSMTLLAEIDMSSVVIEEYSGVDGTIYNTDTLYAANSIPDLAFESKYTLQTITLPATVTSIGRAAFLYAGLTSISIPNSVTSIGSFAFSNCIHLTNIEIPDNVLEISDFAFNDCSGLITVKIPEGISSIGKSVFSGCTNLTDITIPGTVKAIGFSAFYYCSSLKNIIIPDGVTSIADYAFFNCLGFSTLTIPNSVTSIGTRAFGRCLNLTSIYTHSVQPISLYFSTSVFQFIDKSTCSLYVPIGTKELYQSAYQWNEFQNIKEFTTGLLSTTQSDIKINCEHNKLIIKNAEIGSRVEIFAMSGQKITEQSVKGHSTEISLDKGVYILRVGNYSRRLIIE